MTEQVRHAYDNWFSKYFGKTLIQTNQGAWFKPNQNDIQAAFLAGFKLGTFLQTGKNEVKQIQ